MGAHALPCKDDHVARLGELGLTVGDLDFGGIDAESDFGLDEYFVTTPYVRYALEGRRT